MLRTFQFVFLHKAKMGLKTYNVSPNEKHIKASWPMLQVDATVSYISMHMQLSVLVLLSL